MLSDAAHNRGCRGRIHGRRLVEGGALDPLVGPQCSLAVQLRRATGAVIGRSAELDAVTQELRDASGRLAAVTLEGEPGIGKTRLLLAASELASASGFTCVAITADEEIRGPFLVARSLFAASAIHDTAAGTPAEAAVRRVVEAISGRDEPGFETLSPDAKLLRAFDLAGVAISTLAGIHPLALFIDDVQWADDDSLRLLRYVVRSDADRPVFLFLTIRPDEFASVTEAVNFVADMERMGLVRRLRPGRFSSVETAELLKRVLGGPVEAASAAAVQAQSEGVPFIVEELARTHREAGTFQQIDGEWRLGRSAARLVPSAVRTLIDRRAARLPARTRASLGDAAILGRSFSLRDLRAIRMRVGDGEVAAEAATVRRRPRAARTSAGPGDGADPLADDLGPAVRAGLLLPQAQGEPADYTFTHEQVRQFAANQLSAARRRQVHAAVVDLLLEGGDPAPAGLPMLAQHALAAGDTGRAARFSIDAATAALASNAPEEALRLVEQALPVVSAPADRRVLLATRDDAFAVLRRTGERLDGLTELAALAEAMRDPNVELDVQLRRASALRMSHDEDAAAELARRVRARAAEQGDARPGAPGVARAGPGAPAEPAGRVVRRRGGRDRPRRCRAGLSPRDRAGGAARRRAQPRRGPPRDRDDRLRTWARVVRRRGPRRSGERGARDPRDGRQRRGAAPVDADRAAVRRGDPGPRAGAGHLRAARRPNGRHVDGHRHGLRAVRAGHAPDVLGAASRGDPARDEPPVRARHGERAGPPGPPDAVRRPRVLQGQGGAGPGAVPRRGRPSGGQAPGRPDHRVPRRRRRGDEPARARRRRRGGAMDRPGRRRGVHGPVAIARPPARDLARDGPSGCGRRRRHAPSSRARRGAGDRGRPGIRAVRGPGPPRHRGGAARRGRPVRWFAARGRPHRTRRWWSSSSGRRRR